MSGEAGEFVAGGVGEEGEDADAGAWRQLAGGGGAGVADNGRGLIETASPSRAGYVAEDEAIVFDTCGFEDGAGDLNEVGPAGGDTDEAAVERREPGVKPGTSGVDLERDQFDPGRKQRTDGVGLAGTAEGDGREGGVGFCAVFEGGGGDGEDGELENFGEQNIADLRIGLDEEEVIGRRRGKPLGDAPSDICGRHVEFADCAKESGDVLIKNLLRSGGGCGVVPDVDAAAVAELCPAIACELAISCADGVGVNTEAAGEFAGAGEAVAGAKISSEDGEHHLRHQLAVDRYFAGGRKPEAHEIIVAGNGETGIKD